MGMGPLCCFTFDRSLYDHTHFSFVYLFVPDHRLFSYSDVSEGTLIYCFLLFMISYGMCLGSVANDLAVKAQIRLLPIGTHPLFPVLSLFLLP